MFRTLGTLFFTLICSGAIAQEADLSRILEREPSTLAEEEEYNAASYAKQFEVSFNEAKRRLRLQDERGELTAALEQEFESRLSGMFIQHKPDYRIVVRLTGGGPVPDRTVQLPSGKLPVEFREGAPATKASLLEALSRHQGALQRMFPDLQGSRVDDETGEIIVSIYAKKSEHKNYLQEQEAVSRLIGYPVRIEFIDTRESEASSIYGGGFFYFPTKLCTTGFNVRVPTTNVRGTLTAGHCPNDSGATYTNWQLPSSDKYVSVPLPKALIEHYDGSRDFQFHPLPASSGHSVGGGFFGTGTRDPSPLISRRSRSSTEPGDTVCHRGVITGSSCGVVQSTTHLPPPGKCGASSCNSTWVSVVGPDLACASGDSGGPFFKTWTGYGMAKTASSSGPDKGQCNIITYMSLDFVVEAGFDIL